MRKVQPLTGQVLIEVLPEDAKSPGGIDLPNRGLSAEEVQERHQNPEKPPGAYGIVRAIGPWPKLKCGLALMPEYGMGAKVFFNPLRGIAMQWDTTRKLRMIMQEDVLAVVK